MIKLIQKKFLSQLITLKTNCIYNKLAKEAESHGETKYGIKGQTSLSKLLVIPDQIPYDYMHLVLQGHSKWILYKLFKSKSSPIFIKEIDALEESLLKIKIPHFMNRKPRSLKEINKWKSVEIKLFKFYFAVLLLIECMPRIYYCHYACCIFAIRMRH